MPTNNNSVAKPIILIICNYYLPGYKSGGGLRTVVNMVEHFRVTYDFRIITFDHDADDKPYTSVKINEWNDLDGTKVFYLSTKNVKLSKLRELIKEVEPDSIYLNSVFSTLTIFVLTLKRLKLIPQINVILAPEGELSDGALQLKAAKKKTFIGFAKTSGLYQKLIWKTTSELEKQETKRFKGAGGKIFIAPNMPSRRLLEGFQQNLKQKKEIGEAKMIFLSRFARKKNFGWLVENLKNIQGNLVIDIFGPIEDEHYWRQTQKNIGNLPDNVKVEYKGLLIYEEVFAKLCEYQFFILPTLGENFGHVFIEALAAGCPLVISNRTPWLELEKEGIGWDIPLEKPQAWIEVINHCIKIDSVNYKNMSSNARGFACRWLADSKVEENTSIVLKHSLSKASSNSS